MIIDRPELEQSLSDFAEQAHGVVIGPPGSGKSFLLQRLAKRSLEDPESYCLFFPVDRLPIETESDLRKELGIDVDVIAFAASEARAIRRAYFIVDALDAARSEQSRAFFFHLIRRAIRGLDEHWRVVASVRTYEALRSAELDEIFPVSSAEPSNDRYRLHGAVCRNLFVPLLSDSELASVSGSPEFEVQRTAASPALQELLRVPFNLWLLERIVEHAGVDTGLAAVGSEVELLDLFWHLRVEQGETATENRLVLERAVAKMIEQQGLTIPTEDLYSSNYQRAWHQLHSSEVLETSTDGPARTGFTHNILFDFAVSRLAIGGAPDGVLQFLEPDPARAFFLRPSLEYFFTRAWFGDRPRFWTNTFAVAEADVQHVRLFARVLPPTVVAREVRQVDDLDPIVAALAEGQSATEDLVLRVLQSVRYLDFPSPGVWAEVVERIARLVSRVFAWELVLVMDGLLHAAAEVGDSIGRAARDLLEWAFVQRVGDPMVDRLASVWLVPLVARTADTAPDESAALLQRVIDDVGDPEVSVDYAFRAANEFESLWEALPEVAAALYTKIFSHFESSEEPTHMGGIVVSLTSTRRQDYEMAQFVLKGKTAGFLHDRPDVAISSVVTAIKAQTVIRELAGRVEPDRLSMSTFELLGETATFIRDGSHWWDAAGTVREGQHALADDLMAYLGEVADSAGDLPGALRIVVREAEIAFLWRRLLREATRHQASIGRLLADLLIVPEILTSPETLKEAADFVAALIPEVDDEVARGVEDAIVGLVEITSDSDASHAQARLIQQFPEGRLQTEQGRKLRAETRGLTTAVENRPLAEFHSSVSRYTDEEWLRDQGIDPTENAVREILVATEALSAFESEYRNASPPDEAIRGIVPALRAAVGTVDQSALDDPVFDSAWAKIGGAAVALVRHADRLNEEELAFARAILLRCASGRAPDPAMVGEFTFPTWSPAARNSAAEGLPLLAPAENDDEVLSAIRDLAADEVPSVRYLLAMEMWRLANSAEATFWELIESYVHRESNAAVLDAVGRTLGLVTTIENEEKVTQVLAELLARPDVLKSQRTRNKTEDHTASLVTGLAFARGNRWALSRVQEALGGLPQSAHEVSTYLWFALQFVHVDRVDIPDFQPSLERALSWISDAVAIVAAGLEGEVQAARSDQGSEGTVRQLFKLVDEIVSRLYFNSGIYEREGHPSATTPQICDYFGHVKPVLQRLVDSTGGTDGSGLPASTAHYFVQLLRGSLACDPATVIHMTRQVVDSAAGAGYAFDSLGAGEVTALVETVLADFRHVVQTGEPLDDLMALLDAFVSAGWPEAQRIVLRLDEIFR